MKNIMKEIKGITMIALVVTIVILIILAGILINITIGDNGLINMAKKAKTEYEDVIDDENTKINDIYGQLLVATDGTINNIDAQTLNQLIDARVQAQLANYSPVTNYSAEQQAIGTWMGNKTLYQKTFTGIADNYDASGNYVVGSIPEGARVIKIEGFIYWNNGTDQSINYSGGGMLPFNDTAKGEKVIAFAYGTGSIGLQSSLKQFWPYVITVQYTLD